MSDEAAVQSNSGEALEKLFLKVNLALKFTSMTARMHRAGEVYYAHTANPHEAHKYEPDGASDEDAQALYRLILEAREITGEKPADLIEGAHLHICQSCGISHACTAAHPIWDQEDSDCRWHLEALCPTCEPLTNKGD